MQPHADYMKMALEEARRAMQIDEVPVGAVLVNESGDLLYVCRRSALRTS